MIDYRYKDVEDDVQRHPMSKRLLASSPLFVSWVNRSRRYANRLAYSDEETLTIARNRIRLQEAHKSDLFSRLQAIWRTFRGKPMPEEPYRVTGQELRTLMSLAGVEPGEAIIAGHEYDVASGYYERLVERALEAQGNG